MISLRLSVSALYLVRRVVERGHHAKVGHLCPCQRDGPGHVFANLVSRDNTDSQGCPNLPLQIVRSWVFVFSVGAKWTDISRGIMNESMPNHFVFPLEPLAAFAPWTASHGAIVGTLRGMDVGVGIQEILRLKRRSITPRESTNISCRVGCHSLDTHLVDNQSCRS
jgi:hypothetical protein